MAAAEAQIEESTTGVVGSTAEAVAAPIVDDDDLEEEVTFPDSAMSQSAVETPVVTVDHSSVESRKKNKMRPKPVVVQLEAQPPPPPSGLTNVDETQAEANVDEQPPPPPPPIGEVKFDVQPPPPPPRDLPNVAPGPTVPTPSSLEVFLAPVDSDDDGEATAVVGAGSNATFVITVLEARPIWSISPMASLCF